MFCLNEVSIKSYYKVKKTYKSFTKPKNNNFAYAPKNKQ